MKGAVSPSHGEFLWCLRLFARRWHCSNTHCLLGLSHRTDEAWVREPAVHSDHFAVEFGAEKKEFGAELLSVAIVALSLAVVLFEDCIDDNHHPWLNEPLESEAELLRRRDHTAEILLTSSSPHFPLKHTHTHKLVFTRMVTCLFRVCVRSNECVLDTSMQLINSQCHHPVTNSFDLWSLSYVTCHNGCCQWQRGPNESCSCWCVRLVFFLSSCFIAEER